MKLKLQLKRRQFFSFSAPRKSSVPPSWREDDGLKVKLVLFRITKSKIVLRENNMEQATNDTIALIEAVFAYFANHS